MIGLAEIKDWLKTFQVADYYYIGKLDNKKPRSLGVYQRRPSGSARIAIGGKENTKYDEKQISVLLHWTNNARETEEAAFSLFEKLQDLTNITIGDTHVYFVRVEVPEPIDVGTDASGVYERVIWLDLIYERS